ncbi:MAG: hypothetical protein Q9171_004149 [Xanthocarpia ochracea]
MSAQNNIQIIHQRTPRRTFHKSKTCAFSTESNHPASITSPKMPAATELSSSSTTQQNTTPKENSFPCSFPRGSTPPARSLFKTILTVTVGEEKKSFLVHREVLCSVSPFFAAALKPSYDFRESRSSNFHLPSARPIDFEYLVQWIYTRTLTHEEVAAPHPAYFRLIRLWILADELQVEGCKNAIIDFMAKTADESNSVPTPDDTVTVFGEGGVREGSGMRSLVVDLFAWKKTDHLVEGHEDTWDESFLRLLVARLKRMNWHEKGHAPWRNQITRCRLYHEHNDQSTCGDSEKKNHLIITAGSDCSSTSYTGAGGHEIRDEVEQSAYGVNIDVAFWAIVIPRGNLVMSAARLLEKRTHQVPGKLRISEYFFEVPLNHESPQDGTLWLFARSVEPYKKPVDVVEDEANQLPWSFILGGLAPVVVEQPDPVYQNLYYKVAERNRSYYDKYSEDIHHVKNIIHYLQTEKVILPSGGIISIARFRQLGIEFGFHGGIDRVHDIILRLATDLDYCGYFTRPTLAEFESMQVFDNSPLYALLHEAIYLQGNHASNWSADRIMKEYPAFMNLSTSNDEPIFFTGEMIYPSMFRDYIELRNLAPTADILAQMTSWPPLYNTERLANNDVPVYASIYIDDMYVSYDFARETAMKIKSCKTFITNAMYHDAIGAAGKSKEVFRQLFGLRDDVMD